MKKIIVTKLFFFLSTVYIFAQGGNIDPSFNIRLGVGANFDVFEVVKQNDNKILVVGAFVNYGGKLNNSIVRLNEDGTIDSTFNSGNGANNSIKTVVLQPDGKIIIAGGFTSYNGVARNNLARLNANGTLDTTFNSASDFVSYNAVALQSDGKIIVGGFFSTYGGFARKNIVRLNTDGTIDTNFDPLLGPSSTVNDIIVQSNGKILIVGAFTSYNGIVRNRIASINSDGTLNTTFTPGSGANGEVKTIAVQVDDKIIIGGGFSTYGSVARGSIARLNANGTLDNTFNPGTGANSTVESIKILSTGKILLSGSFTNYNNITTNSIASINPNGTLDTTFNTGTGANQTVFSAVENTNGKIIIGGKFTSFNTITIGRLSQLNADGSVDSNFFNPTGFNSGFFGIGNRCMVRQPDGKIIVGGTIDAYNGITRSNLARLNEDGTLDTAFLASTNNEVNFISLQADGKIIIGGFFTVCNGVTRNRIARLNVDGTLDNSFNTGTGFNSLVRCVAAQPDGKIIVGGEFTSYNGTTQNRFTRLNADGTIDNTFNVGTGADLPVKYISIQADSKILISGEFTTYNGVPKRYFLRLNIDGTLDTTFNIGGSGVAFPGPEFIAEQVDNKILIGGAFNSYNGVARKNIARLNANGSLDNTFVPGIMFYANTGSNNNGDIYAMATQSDGKIVIGGLINSYDGTPTNGIARLNSNGSLDTTFDSGPGIDNCWVFTIIIQPDQKILLTGIFNNYKGSFVNKIARLLSDNTVLSVDVFNKISFSVYPNPSKGIFTIQTENLIENAAITVADLNGRIVYQTRSENLNNQKLDLSKLQSGMYILTITSGNNKYSQKLIKQ